MKLHFVRSIRGLQNFLAIPIMNTLAGFMINIIYIIINIKVQYNLPCWLLLMKSILTQAELRND